MQTIKIFLGSSLDELYNERRLLGDYIMNSVRPIFKYDEIDVELLKCEDMDLGYTGEPSQNIINGQLKDCNYFIFVFKLKAGDQTRLEYDIARAIQKAGEHKTTIRVYLLNGPDEGKEQRLLDFQEQLKRDGLYWSTYNNPEDLRGKIEHHLIQFERQLLGKTKPSAFEQESEMEKDGDTLFADFMKDEEKRTQRKEKIHQNIEDLLVQIKTVMDNEDETIAARVFRVIELYKKADQWAAATDYDKEKYSNLLIDYAVFLDDYGLYRHAETIYLRQIELAEELYGISDKKTIISYNKIGRLYFEQSDYQKAKEYLEKALSVNKSISNVCDKDTAKIYDDLGSVFWKQGDHKTALKFLKYALKLRKATLGIAHCDTAESYNNIGLVYDDMNKFPEALRFFEKSLSILEKSSHTKISDLATVYGNMGFVYTHMKKLDKAFEYCKKCLKIKREVLGINHPATATAYHNIGKVHLEQNNYSMALKYFKKAMKIDEDILGSDHPDTATDYNSLGIAYFKTKDYKKALSYLNKALAIRQNKLNPKHHCIIETQELIEIVKDALDKGLSIRTQKKDKNVS